MPASIVPPACFTPFGRRQRGRPTLAVALAACVAVACHDSRSRPPAVAPATLNLKASAVEITTTSPRIGHPVELVTRIEANENATDVTVSYYAQNAQDVADGLEQVRQFYLGTVTFASVQPAIVDYRASLIVPTSVTPPGDYVILAAIDPSELVPETDEADNRAEQGATFLPLQDPNLKLQELTLDAQSILLDPDVDDVMTAQPTDVQNADLGATVTVALEGTLQPVDVETFVRLRITRTDRPAGQDTHDVPLYLWDSDAQRYVDAYGVGGTVEWLPFGAVVPQRVTESENDVDVAEPGTYAAHLDLYLPGKLSEVMIQILENLVSGPPPTVPPPDLRLEDIQALQTFFGGATQSAVRFSIVVDVRARDASFVDSDPGDDRASQPVYLVLPGQESFAPDRPLAFEQGLQQQWGSDKFGAGFGFDAFASLDGRGAIAEVNGGLTVEVLGSRFEFLHLDARGQVVPQVDPAVTGDETSGFGLDLQFAGITVYSLQRELGYTYDGSFRVSKEKSFTRQFFVGPVPVSATGGVTGEVGFALIANLQPVALTSNVGPFAGLEASLEAGVGVLGLRAGAGGALKLIDERFQGDVLAGLAVVAASAPAVFEGNVSMQVANVVTGPTGRLYLFVEYPGIKWCRVFGIPLPCGIKRVRKEWGLVSWASFVKEDVLFDRTWCKRVVLDGGNPSFASCAP